MSALKVYANTDIEMDAPNPPQSQPKLPVPTLALSPHGKLYLEAASGDSPDRASWDPAVMERVRRAFEKGSADGLWWLGAREVDSVLPPVFAGWRDFARIFMHHLCMPPEEDGSRKPEIPFPTEDAQRWLEAAPLMTGAEYRSLDVLQELWADMGTAFWSGRQTFAGSLQGYLQSLHPVWNQVGRVYLHLAENNAKR